MGPGLLTRSSLLAFALGALATVTVLALIGGAGARWWRRWVQRASLRAHKRFGARIDRFKLADRATIIATVLEDPAVATAVREHSAEHGVSEHDAWAKVRTYLNEVVPAFSLWFYYKVGLAIAEAVLKLFFRVSVVEKDTRALAGNLGEGQGKNGAATGALAAKLMLPANGARLMMIETGGWDTHSGQKGRLNAGLNGLDQMIAAIKTGLGAAWADTMILVATEFGRTVAVNGTGGTDHGTASAAMLIGGAVKGGRVVADWPGLRASDQIPIILILKPS